jgi:AraC-like DNA-binding protein
MMEGFGPGEKVYPVVEIAAVLEAMSLEGIPHQNLLARMRLSKAALTSPRTRISIGQLLDCFEFAAGHTPDPFFAYRAGLRLHVSAFGAYGFALLSSTNYRQTMKFAETYHRLVTPLTDIQFTEENGLGVWSFVPIAHDRIDAGVYRFIVEMGFGITLSLHRDVMGQSFRPRELHLAYPKPTNAADYERVFETAVIFGQERNKFVFDAAWLDGTPMLSNEIAYATLRDLCKSQLTEFEELKGVSGRVTQALLENLPRSLSFEQVAENLNMSPRTLRRRLEDENTTYRQLCDDVRMKMAIRYLRDTRLTIEQIADALGFSDAANFRHAFHRWTSESPHSFRGLRSVAAPQPEA